MATRGPKVSKSIEDIWNPSKATYILDQKRFVDIKKTITSDEAVKQLKQKVDSNIQDLEAKNIEVKALYIGKTYVLNKEGDIRDARNPKKWDKSGLSSRWSTSHKSPKPEEKKGKRNMIVLTTAITENDVPENYKSNQEKVTASCDAESYTLYLEQQLIKECKIDPKLYMEQTTTSEGGTGSNKGYVLYMRITYKVGASSKEVRSINLLLCIIVITTTLHTL